MTVRSIDDARTWLRERLDQGLHPFVGFDRGAATEVIDALEAIDPETWASAWGGRAQTFAARAAATEDSDTARSLWYRAYQFAFLGRYPSPIHPAKRVCYDLDREYFLNYLGCDPLAAERVEVPFAGRSGEGNSVAFYVGRPPGADRPPVVVMWGGIDMWKEESYERGAPFRERGFATVHVDMPGVGESPVLAGVDAERMWDPVLNWIASSDLDVSRVVVLGQSFGGYWALKLAHTHANRLAGAVNWGGGVHRSFQPEWQEHSRDSSSYLMDLMATRARVFGGETFEDYVVAAPCLSLLDQGVLDLPHCPILMVNGKDDQQNSIDDLYLPLEHGGPKSARVFAGGHMGIGPVVPTVIGWIESILGGIA